MKIVNKIIFGGVTVIATVTFYFIAKKYFEPDKINDHEKRFYIILGMIMLGVISFAMLRQYNAMVVNTTFLKNLGHRISNLNTTVGKNNTELSKTEVSYKNSSRMFENLANAFNAFIKALNDNAPTEDKK